MITSPTPRELGASFYREGRHYNPFDELNAMSQPNLYYVQFNEGYEAAQILEEEEKIANAGYFNEETI